MLNTNQKATDELNEMLKNELAAGRAYEIAQKTFGNNHPVSSELRKISAEHQSSSTKLVKEIQRAGGEPIRDAGALGSFAALATGAAKALGKSAVLKTLEKGEQSCTKTYQNARKSKNLDYEAKILLERTMIPKQAQHVSSLQQLQGVMK